MSETYRRVRPERIPVTPTVMERKWHVSCAARGVEAGSVAEAFAELEKMVLEGHGGVTVIETSSAPRTLARPAAAPAETAGPQLDLFG